MALSDHELMWCFESIGIDCEMGLLQRHFKAEPPGLLRWDGNHVEELVNALDKDFEGLGDDAELLLIGDEYYFCERRYRINRHTGAFRQYDIDPERLLARQKRQIKSLFRTFRENVADGSKIFIHKDFDGAGPDLIVRLAQTLRRYGPAKLLFVQEHGRAASLPDLETLFEGVWWGRLPRFGNREGAPWDIAIDQWMSMLRKVHSQSGLA